GAEATEIEGTGVGLALAKQLIESMGGEIGFRSAAGEGSVFWIEMPASRGATGEAPAPEAPPPEAPKRILYIDDDAAGLKFVADYMDGRADVAMTGADRAAAGLARAWAEPFDLILVNPETRDADGVDLVANLRRAQPGVPILAVAPDDAAVELADRFDGYVGRPARLLNLEREIAQRLRQLG
ncbi:MAG: ATP-binding protein, partial [Alphaproteobacteria bacterium]